MHSNLRPPDVALVILSCMFFDKFVLCMRISCYVSASNQNSDIRIRFSDQDFPKVSNNLAIRRRFHVVTLTFDHLTLNVCNTSGVT